MIQSEYDRMKAKQIIDKALEAEAITEAQYKKFEGDISLYGRLQIDTKMFNKLKKFS